MGKYLVLWDGNVNPSSVPAKPAERAQMYTQMLQAIKDDKGIKDWGLFLGWGKGYIIFEGSEIDLELSTQKFIPFLGFKTYTIIGLEEAEKIVQALMQA